MHEVSVALGMVDELTRIASENKAKKIVSIRLKIGRLSGIVTDSLEFAFDAIKADNPLIASSKLVVDEVPLVYQCNECDKSFEAADIYFPACQGCGSNDLKIISGEEQHIENVEMEV